jgi:hypothetical protein
LLSRKKGAGYWERTDFVPRNCHDKFREVVQGETWRMGESRRNTKAKTRDN